MKLRTHHKRRKRRELREAQVVKRALTALAKHIAEHAAAELIFRIYGVRV